MLGKICHTQISNDFLDNYMHKLGGSDIKIFLGIARKTIGWHKETDYISISQLEKMTGLSNRVIIKSINNLIEIGLIIKTSTKHTNKYTINYDEKSQVETPQSDEKSQVETPQSDEKSQVETPQSDEKSHTKEILKEKGLIIDDNKKLSSIEFSKNNPSLSTSLYIDNLVNAFELINSKEDENKKIHNKIRKWFEKVNPLYYHDGKQAKCINNIIKKSKKKEDIIKMVLEKYYKLVIGEYKFWVEQPLTPCACLGLWDRIISAKLREDECNG